MNRLERLGAELAMLLRRHRDKQRELDEIAELLQVKQEEIFQAEPEWLYGQPSGEWQTVGDERDTSIIPAVSGQQPCPGVNCPYHEYGQYHVHDNLGRPYSASPSAQREW